MGVVDETYARVHFALRNLAREARPIEQYVIRVSPEHYADMVWENRRDNRFMVELLHQNGTRLGGIPIERDTRLEGTEIRLVHEIDA